MCEFSVTPKNTSGNIVESYNLRVDGKEIAEEPADIEEGEHTIRVDAKGLEPTIREIELEEDRNEVIRMSPSNQVLVSPNQETLENLTNEELARSVESSSHLVEVNKASSNYIEFYSPEAEVAKIEIVESENDDIEHEYEYVSKVIVEMDSKYRYDTTDVDKKGVFCKRFSSPLRAIREIENRIREEIDSVF